jgi:uncharacterized membrane protein YkoI
MTIKMMRLVFVVIGTVGLALGCSSGKVSERQAKISKADAEKVAMAQAPTGTIQEAELEKEHGRLIWSFDMKVPGAADITEVNVDALTGQLVSVEHEKKD